MYHNWRTSLFQISESLFQIFGVIELKADIRILLGAIFEAKRTGKGRTGRGKIYVELMQIIADNSTDISERFGGSIDRFLLRLLRSETDYPYSLFSFEKFEQSIGNYNSYQNYLVKMHKFCSAVLDEDKVEQLVYTLLEIIRQDSSISTILYSFDYISKEKLFGSYAHPKRICLEALLLGLLYHVHKNPAESESIGLLEIPEKLTFHVARYKDENSLALEMPIDLIENISENAKRQKSVEMKYQLELNYNNIAIDELPDNKNIFIYGTGGSGKTTLLMNQIGNENTVSFYFPLYHYRREIHENFQSGGCWILLQILLKYHYQYEYHTYETLTANEGESTVLQQLTELDKLLKSTPVNGQPDYTLLLDGLNEMSAELQRDFMKELEWFCHSWRNLRINITGRTLPNYALFDDFKCIEIGGVTDSDLYNALAENGIILTDVKLMEILKNPLFLNIYLEKISGVNTRGELIDWYFMNWNGNDTVRFIIQFVLPFVGKRMLEEWSLFEISRAEVMELTDKAIKIYVFDDYVYQNYIAPKNINKKSLLESRQNDDWIELLIKSVGLMAESESDMKKLHFVHQYYRDYFAAKHIVNAISVFETGRISAESPDKYFSEIGLSGKWFDNMELFPEKKDVYALISEICGEYINDVNNENFYTYTLLDKFLDICRQLDVEYSVENIFIAKSIIHNNLICGVDFSFLNLPLIISSDIRFSLNGKYPCDFTDTRVYGVDVSDDTQAKNFENCNFSGARFLDAEVKETLHKMGAIVDFEDDNFMDSLYRDILLPWIGS